MAKKLTTAAAVLFVSEFVYRLHTAATSPALILIVMLAMLALAWLMGAHYGYSKRKGRRTAGAVSSGKG